MKIDPFSRKDRVTGRIASLGMSDAAARELRDVYSRTKRRIGNDTLDSPESHGYRESQTESELFAQGVAAYLRNPNSFKKLAPNAAAFIRGLVNEHPELSKHLQFASNEETSSSLA